MLQINNVILFFKSEGFLSFTTVVPPAWLARRCLGAFCQINLSGIDTLIKDLTKATSRTTVLSTGKWCFFGMNT